MKTKIYIENRIALIERMLERPKLFCLNEKDITKYKDEIEILKSIKLTEVNKNDFPCLDYLPIRSNNDNPFRYFTMEILENRLKVITEFLDESKNGIEYNIPYETYLEFSAEALLIKDIIKHVERRLKL